MKRLHVGFWVVLLFLQTVYGASFTLSGSVISDNQKMITSKFMGFVKEVYVGEGDVVKKGDVLYVIDSKEIDSALSQANLSIAQGELSTQMHVNQYQNAMLNLERHKRLFAKDMVSKFEVENLELTTQNLNAMVEISKKQSLQAKQKQQEVLNQYQYLKVTAPNDSVVVTKNIKVGEMAMPSVPAFILSDLSSLKIITEVSESNLKDVPIGKLVTFEIPSINLKSQGTVESIVPSSNLLTHTFKVKITFDKKEAMIYPNMYAIVTFGEQ